MAKESKDGMADARHDARGQKSPRVVRRKFGRFRASWRVCLTAGGYLLMALLCSLAAYLWRAPLPALAGPQMSEGGPASRPTVGRDGSKASLEICLRQVKLRELFKPSVPVASEDRVGKSTAQELAERLQFLGIMQEAGATAALVFIPNRGPGTFRVGDRVAEFMLKEVQPDRLTLELGDEQAILKR